MAVKVHFQLRKLPSWYSLITSGFTSTLNLTFVLVLPVASGSMLASGFSPSANNGFGTVVRLIRTRPFFRPCHWGGLSPAEGALRDLLGGAPLGAELDPALSNSANGSRCFSFRFRVDE